MSFLPRTAGFAPALSCLRILALSVGLLAGLSGQQAAYGQQVGAGAAYSVAIRADGTLWTWGDNRYESGWSDEKDKVEPPVALLSGTTWQALGAGETHTLAVRTDGTLWGWGQNQRGQVGNNTTSYRPTPTQLGSATNWRSVAAGAAHSLAVRADGTLWTWGDNQKGQLGDPTVNRASSHAGEIQPKPAARGKTTNAKPAASPPLVNKAYRAVPAQVGVATWQSVAAGGTYSLGVQTNGTLWAWGSNPELVADDQEQWGFPGGQEPKPELAVPVRVGSATTWQRIDAGSNHALALRQDGTLWAWGNNQAGQLGTGTNTFAKEPVQVGTGTTWQSIAAGESFSLAVRADGTLWAWGNIAYHKPGTPGNDWTTPTQIGTATTWATVAAGSKHAVATQTDGTIWSWGDNGGGQLGHQPSTHVSDSRVGTSPELITELSPKAR
nr:hypothetical protein [Hymenobacter translucens]